MANSTRPPRHALPCPKNLTRREKIMAPIVTTVDIARPPEAVFSYVTDPALFREWQEGVVSGHLEAADVAAVGTRCVMTRRIGGAERTSTSEITELDPPLT